MGVTVAMIGLLVLAGTGIYVGLKTLENYNPGKKKIQKDIIELKRELQPHISEIVPWSEEEMSQLSINQINKKSSKRIVTTKKGVFTTIYHEPLIAWASRKYVSSKTNALVYAKTSHHEFIYRVKKNKVDVVIDDQLIGQINEDGILEQVKGRKALAQINRSSETLGLPILVNQREAGRLATPESSNSPNPRAFNIVSKMDGEEEKLFLAMSIFELIKAQG